MATLAANGARDFIAVAVDAFNQPLAVQPTFVWSTTGSVTVSAGHVVAGASVGGPYLVRATSGGITGEASVAVSPASPPTVVTPAAATVLTPQTRQLQVLGADDGGEGSLHYYWAWLTGPAPVAFSVNGTNAAKSAVATFRRAGTYRLQATVVDANGAVAISTVDVNLPATATQLKVSPTTAGVAPNAPFPFRAVVLDEFGEPIPNGSTGWSVSGGGTVSGGLFTAGGAVGGPFTLTATSGSLQATAQIQVISGSGPTWAAFGAASPARVDGSATQLSALGLDDAGEAALTYQWAQVSGPGSVSFALNGTNDAKLSTAVFDRPGRHVVSVTATDAAGLTASSTVDIEVVSSVNQVSLTPSSASVPTGGVQPFEAHGPDQFNVETTFSPFNLSWNASGGGVVGPLGLFLARFVPGGPFIVSASSSPASVVVVPDLPFVDTEAPKVSWVQPATGARLKLTPVMIVDATDNLLVTQVSFSVDGNPLGSLDQPPWEMTLDTRLLRNGTHTLEVRATDGAGNVGQAETLTVDVLNLAGPELGGITGFVSCGTPGLDPVALLTALVLLSRRSGRLPARASGRSDEAR